MSSLLLFYRWVNWDTEWLGGLQSASDDSRNQIQISGSRIDALSLHWMWSFCHNFINVWETSKMIRSAQWEQWLCGLYLSLNHCSKLEFSGLFLLPDLTSLTTQHASTPFCFLHCSLSLRKCHNYFNNSSNTELESEWLWNCSSGHWLLVTDISVIWNSLFPVNGQSQ
jgi:hypothetical protein